MAGFSQIFRALKYRNFRLFFPGLVITQIGIWIQNVTLTWLIYDMTKSAFLTGLIMFLNTFPYFIVTPFAGVIIDKFDKHKLLMFVQICFTLQSFIITCLAYTGKLSVGAIIFLGIFLNLTASLDTPLRQSMFVLLVDNKKDLQNAISLNSTCFNLAKIVGPALAGVFIAKFGVEFCFAVNFVCCLPALLFVKKMNILYVKSEILEKESLIEGFKEGLSYVAKNHEIKTLLIFVAVYSVLGMTYPTLMPIYTKEILSAQSDVLGTLMSFAGWGALGASLALASKTSIHGMRRFLFVGTLLFGLGFILMGIFHSINFAKLFMFMTGFGMTSSVTPANTLIQSVVDNDKRGRVMSIHSVCFVGTIAFSNFLSGFTAQIFGADGAFTLLGSLLIISSLFFSHKISKFTFL